MHWNDTFVHDVSDMCGNLFKYMWQYLPSYKLFLRTNASAQMVDIEAFYKSLRREGGTNSL